MLFVSALWWSLLLRLSAHHGRSPVPIWYYGLSWELVRFWQVQKIELLVLIYNYHEVFASSWQGLWFGRLSPQHWEGHQLQLNHTRVVDRLDTMGQELYKRRTMQGGWRRLRTQWLLPEMRKPSQWTAQISQWEAQVQQCQPLTRRTAALKALDPRTRAFREYTGTGEHWKETPGPQLIPYQDWQLPWECYLRCSCEECLGLSFSSCARIRNHQQVHIVL